MSVMIITTTDDIPGRKIVETMGLVRGSSIRTRHVIQDFTEWLRNLVGAELHHYTKMMGESREQALDRLRAHAAETGANAVIGLRFELSNIISGASEFLAYGTAVRVE